MSLVSVILPCYNAMPYLPEALESILNQTYTNLEIICINDGSTDNTGEVLESYSLKDNRIRVIHNETNIKLIATLNKGIGLAKGKYIARMDADDISSPDRIEELLNFLNKFNADVVSCATQFISESGRVISRNPLKCRSFLEVKFSSFFFTPISHASLLAKTQVFRKYLYSKESSNLHVEDYELWTRLIRNGVIILNLDKILYSIRVNQQSVSRKYEKIQVENFVFCANAHQSKFLNREVPLEVTSVAVNRMENASLETARQGFSLIDEITNKFLTSKNLDTDAKSVKEIHTISQMQKSDIAIQLIKKGKQTLQLFGSYRLATLLLRNLFNQQFIKYISSKIRGRKN